MNRGARAGLCQRPARLIRERQMERGWVAGQSRGWQLAGLPRAERIPPGCTTGARGLPPCQRAPTAQRSGTGIPCAPASPRCARSRIPELCRADRRVVGSTLSGPAHGHASVCFLLSRDKWQQKPGGCAGEKKETLESIKKAVRVFSLLSW